MDPQLTQLILGVLVASLTPVLAKAHASATTKGTLSTMLAGLAALSVEFFSAGDFDATSFATRFLAVIAPVATVVYLAIIEPRIKAQKGLWYRLANIPGLIG